MLSLLYCLGLYNGGTELRNVCVRECVWVSEKEREREILCVSVLVVRVCLCVCVGGVLCVKDSAICEHVYAPLSLNLYMFEWQAATKNIHVWMHNMLVVWQYTQVNKNVTWRDSVCHPQAVAPLCQQGAALLDQCEAVGASAVWAERKDASVFQPHSQSASHISKASRPVNSQGRMCC